MPRAEAQRTSKTSTAGRIRTPRKRAVRRTLPRKGGAVNEPESEIRSAETEMSSVKAEKGSKVAKTTKATKSTKEKEAKVVKEEVRRKAPLRTSPKETGKRTVSKKPFVMLAVMLVAFGASAFIGFSDNGQIDISSVIEERNQKVASGQTEGDAPSPDTSAVIPVQNTAPPSVPNGGLRGRGVGTAKAAPPPPVVESVSSTTATSTATSTDSGVGTSTDEVLEGVDEGEIESKSETSEGEDTDNEIEADETTEVE